MKKLLLHQIVLAIHFFLIISIFGCAAVPLRPAFYTLPEQYRTKALEYEKKGELRKALQSWEIVASFNPEDEEVAKRIKHIKIQIYNIADQHFKRGLSYYQKNSVQAARKEFLLALSYNPEHKEAISYVKYKLSEDNYIFYEVKQGDTLKRITQKIYNDSKKDFLITYFNDLDKNARLTPGTSLKLPVLESRLSKQPIGTETLIKARGLFKVKKYKQAASVAEKILQYDPFNRDARDLVNASYYQMGEMLSRKKKYLDALQIYNYVDPNYKDIKKCIHFVERCIKDKAELHYVRGVKYFVNEEFDKAIKEWETSLTLNPNHHKAKLHIDKVHILLEKLREIK